MYGVSRPGIRLKKPPRPVISINDPPGATSLFTYHAIPLDAPRIPHDHLRQKRRHAELRKKAADRERERRRAARQAKQQAEFQYHILLRVQIKMCTSMSLHQRIP